MFIASQPTITAGAPIGALVNGMLLDPAGFRAVWESSVSVTASEMRQVAEVGLLMADEFVKSGAIPQGDNLTFLRENFQALRHPLFTWDFMSRPITVDAIANSLERVSESAFREVAAKIAERLEMCFALNPSAVKKARRVINPKRPVYFQGVLRKNETDVLLNWADRLRIAGRAKEAKKVYRAAGRKWIEGGKEMLEFSESSIEKNQKDFSIFQVQMALGYFKAAQKAFERAESEYNIWRAQGVIASTRTILKQREHAILGGEPKRTTLVEMFQSVKEGEPESDAELIHMARLAAIGNREAIENFIEEAADILGLPKDELLSKMAAPNRKSWITRLLDKLPPIASTDGFFNSYIGDKTGDDELAGLDAGIRRGLQQLLGEGNDILNHLIPAVRRYAEASK